MATGFKVRSYIGLVNEELTTIEARILPDGEEEEIVFCRYNFPVLPVTSLEANEIHKLFDEFLQKSMPIMTSFTKGGVH